eukprot:GFUD01077685.1.p2 GENE.GFUD01077685.1~~GFUD01077685.1.p2  ORF type:complete len:137 (+),score=50.60 GFUD01077685.1:153-563(+)
MADYVPGKYQMTETENFDEFMERLGVGFITRKLGNRSYPVVTISKEVDEYTMKTESLVKTSEMKFKLGEQFEEITGDGRKVMSTMSMTAPNTMLHQMLGTDGGKDSICSREFMAEKLKVVCQVEEVVTTRMYERKK